MHFYNIQNVTKRGPLFWHLFLIQNAQIAILFDMSDPSGTAVPHCNVLLLIHCKISIILFPSQMEGVIILLPDG